MLCLPHLHLQDGWHCISGQYRPRRQEMFIARTHHVIHFPDVSHAAVFNSHYLVDAGNVGTTDVREPWIATILKSLLLMRGASTRVCCVPGGVSHTSMHQAGHSRKTTYQKSSLARVCGRLPSAGGRMQPPRQSGGADHNLTTAIRRCSYQTRLLLQGTIQLGNVYVAPKGRFSVYFDTPGVECMKPRFDGNCRNYSKANLNLQYIFQSTSF